MRDLGAGVSTLVSTSPCPTNGLNFPAGVSSTGAFVAYYSNCADVMLGDTNSTDYDVFLRGVVDHSIMLVSHQQGGGFSDGSSSGAMAMSPDANTFAFGSTATNLVSGDTNGLRDVFCYHRSGNATEMVSVTPTGEPTSSCGTWGEPVRCRDRRA